MTKQKIFLLRRPTSKIREIECEIDVCEKFTWARDKHGKRHLLGTSAFFTLKAAERSKFGALQKVVEKTQLARIWRNGVNFMYADACKQHDQYKKTGSFH